MKKYMRIIILFVLLILIIPGYNIANNNKKVPTKDKEIKEKIVSDKKEEEPIIEKEPVIEEKARVSIIAAGDIMYHIPQVDAAYVNGILDFSDNFKYVKDYLEFSDIAVANLETTISLDGKYTGYPNFKSPEEGVMSIKDAGFDGLTTANNHIYDKGTEGFENTLETIKKYDLYNIGSSKEENGDKHIIKEINGIKIGMLSYTYVINSIDGTSNINSISKKVNFIDEEKIKNDLEFLKHEKVDLKIIFMHWGIEYNTSSSEHQRELARKIVDWGGDIIFGSHPHVVQESEIIVKDGKDKLVIYSLGNYLSNQREEILGTSLTENGLMVNVIVEKNSDNEVTIKEVKYIPTWLRKYKAENRYIYEILPSEDFINNSELRSILDENEKIKVDKSYNNTIDKMEKLKRND